MPDDEITFQSYLEGPRWAFSVGTIYDFALQCGLTVVAAQEHKGWVTKTIAYTVRGPSDRVAMMQRALNRSIADWNAGRGL